MVGESEVLGKKNLSHCHIILYKNQRTGSGSNPGFSGDSSAANYLDHGTVFEAYFLPYSKDEQSLFQTSTG
jgi:hypothetical protein